MAEKKQAKKAAAPAAAEINKEVKDMISEIQEFNKK